MKFLVFLLFLITGVTAFGLSFDEQKVKAIQAIRNTFPDGYYSPLSPFDLLKNVQTSTNASNINVSLNGTTGIFTANSAWCSFGIGGDEIVHFKPQKKSKQGYIIEVYEANNPNELYCSITYDDWTLTVENYEHKFSILTPCQSYNNGNDGFTFQSYRERQYAQYPRPICFWE